jgi:hypothetical protein
MGGGSETYSPSLGRVTCDARRRREGPSYSSRIVKNCCGDPSAYRTRAEHPAGSWSVVCVPAASCSRTRVPSFTIALT